jgi:oligopeptidase A
MPPNRCRPKWRKPAAGARLPDRPGETRSSAGEKELAQLRAFAQAEFGVDELQPWDIAYYSEKQKQHLYSISDEQLRPYFPENKAVNGLFEVVKRIYGITAKERTDVDVWHPEVRFFELYDENNELRGSFYLDLYARAQTRRAWMR